MPVKIEKKCSRCRRTTSVDVATASDEFKMEEQDKRKAVSAAEVEKFLTGIPATLLPDVIFYVKGEGVILSDICSPGDDAKRSCVKRVTELLKQVEELEERKPRVKKTA
jgi:hypothetical protein